MNSQIQTALHDFSFRTAVLTHTIDNKYEKEVMDMKLDKLVSRERNNLKRGINPSTSWSIVTTRLINHYLTQKNVTQLPWQIFQVICGLIHSKFHILFLIFHLLLLVNTFIIIRKILRCIP